MALAKPMHRSGQNKTSTQTCNSVSHVLIDLADVQMSQCFTMYHQPCVINSETRQMHKIRVVTEVIQ